MLEFLSNSPEGLIMLVTVLISLIVFVLWIVFLENVPKSLKGIEYQLMELNHTLEIQNRKQMSEDAIKNIIKDTIKEMNEQEKKSPAATENSATDKGEDKTEDKTSGFSFINQL